MSWDVNIAILLPALLQQAIQTGTGLLVQTTLLLVGLACAGRWLQKRGPQTAAMCLPGSPDWRCPVRLNHHDLVGAHSCTLDLCASIRFRHAGR